MAENLKESKKNNLKYDDIFQHVKSFGQYQTILFAFMNFLTFPVSSQFSALIFAVGAPDFHCSTANVTCPNKRCCEECTSYQFDGPFTSAVSEWNLICDRAYLGATVQSCYFVGMLIGSLVTGMISDAWGRKKCLFLCNAIMLIAGVASAFVDCISFFAFLRGIVGFGLTGVMLTVYIYGIELVGPQKRTAAGCLAYLYYGAFALLYIPIAYFVPAWRVLLVITTSPAAILFPFWKWIPESPRWLIAHNRMDEALDAIQKYGGKDGKTVDSEVLRNLLVEVRLEQEKKQKEDKKYTPIDLVRTPKVRRWSLILMYHWFTVALVGFGIVLFFTNLSGNLYLNLIFMGIGRLLRVPITWVLFLKFGRRISHCAVISIAGLILLLVLAVYKDFPGATTALTITGAMLISCCWTGVYQITSELFPTLLRNTAQGMGSASARVGGILAPYVAMMAQLPGMSIAFPATIFGVAALIAGILMYWVPETLFSPMRQTIEEVEAADADFGIPCCRKKPKSKDERELENMIQEED